VYCNNLFTSKDQKDQKEDRQMGAPGNIQKNSIDGLTMPMQREVEHNFKRRDCQAVYNTTNPPTM
jgi:hypothetical protein